MPNRYTRENAIESESVNSLTWQAEVFWRRLLNRVDDFGRFTGNPKLLRASIFPLQMDRVSEMDVVRMLLECERAGLLFVYTLQGKPFLALNKWELGRATTSKHPAPPPEVEAKIERFDPLGFGGAATPGAGGMAREEPPPTRTPVRGRVHPRESGTDSDSDYGTENIYPRATEPESQPKPAVPPPRPPLAEVLAFATGPAGIPKAVAEAFWQGMEACGWIDAQHRPVLRWQPALSRFAATWRANDQMKTHQTQRNGHHSATHKPNPRNAFIGGDHDAATAARVAKVKAMQVALREQIPGT